MYSEGGTSDHIREVTKFELTSQRLRAFALRQLISLASFHGTTLYALLIFTQTLNGLHHTSQRLSGALISMGRKIESCAKISLGGFDLW